MPITSAPSQRPVYKLARAPVRLPVKLLRANLSLVAPLSVPRVVVFAPGKRFGAAIRKCKM
jgi:hypothetical protein